MTRAFLKYIYSFFVLGSTLFSVPSFAVESRSEAPLMLLGSIEFEAASLAALPKWTRVLTRIQSEENSYLSCEKNSFSCANDGMLAWRQFIKNLKLNPQNERETVQAVNQFLNQWLYTTDIENWQKSDYWATPFEFVSRAGDCEDYAIIKYVTLKELGLKVNQLRLVVVRDTVRNMPHAVLAVYLEKGDDILILDSLFNTVLSHRDVMQYTPYYSVNEEKRWAHAMPAKNANNIEK